MKLERWTDRVAPLAPAQERAAEQWQALRAEPDLDAMALARLHSRVVHAARPPRRLPHWRWQPALLALVILGTAGIAAATIGAVVKLARPTPTPSLLTPPPAPPKPPRRVAVVRPLSPEIPATSVPAPLPQVPATSAPAREPEVPATSGARPTARVGAVPATSGVVGPREVPATSGVAGPREVPAASMGDGAEVRLFSAAMRAWRERDAGRALAHVAEYQSLFPGGHFAHEAMVVKVDALQALGRPREALAFLWSLSLDGVPRAAELRLIRAELSAKAQRCRDALPDLDRVLAGDPGLTLGARALYARASCRAAVGDPAGAESDLRLYLIRHPDGAHIESVRRALVR